MNALEVGNQSSHKALAKWGSASVERMIECAWCGSRLKGCGCDEYLSTNPQGSGAVNPISGPVES